jgi:hypothetical protein
MSDKYVKQKRRDKIWWLSNPDRTGEFVFSFDRKTNFNLFADYPDKLTADQKALFDKENPHWADFFKDRSKGDG